MNVLKVSPRGFCLGVVQSIKWAKEAVKKYPDKKIYMIGLLVHNKIVVKELEDAGVTTMDDWKKPRIEIINSIDPGSVVIFSAHGTSDEVLIAAEKRGLIIVDTKCEWVEVTEKLIKKYISLDYDIVFVGKHDHPETIALTSIDKNKIHLVTNIDEVQNLSISNTKIFGTNQTTLSLLDTENIYSSLKVKYPLIETKNDLCQATLDRQEAILKLEPNDIDLLFVVGDERSNNTLKLVELAEGKGIKSIRINSVEDIRDEWLKDIKNVAVTAGASTPSITQNTVIKYLEEK